MVLFLLIFIKLVDQSISAGFDHEYPKIEALYRRAVLKNNLGSGVDYKYLSNNLREVESIIHEMTSLRLPAFKKLEENKKSCFLINLYNLYTLKLIAEKYPVETVLYLNSNGFNRKSIFTKKNWKLFGESICLFDFEVKWLIKYTKIPETFFFLNSMTVSGPHMFERPCLPRNFKAQLENLKRKVISSEQLIKYDESKNTIYISELFKHTEHWFDRSGGIKTWILANYPSVSRGSQKNIKFEYIKYNWKLNTIK